MGVVVAAMVEYTISDEKFAAIRKRMSALRRSTPKTLVALYGESHDYVPLEQQKGWYIHGIIVAEFGENALYAYLERKARAVKPRRVRGQYKLGL